MDFAFHSIVLSLMIGLISAAGSTFGFEYYRGKVASQEKKARLVLGITITLIVSAILDMQHFILGKKEELLGEAIAIVVLIVGCLLTWKFLSRHFDE